MTDHPLVTVAIRTHNWVALLRQAVENVLTQGCRGRERPDQTGYVGNENLYTPLACAPCWRENACDFGHECLKRITPGMVTEAVLRQSAQAGEAFPAETYTLEMPDTASL